MLNEQKLKEFYTAKDINAIKEFIDQRTKPHGALGVLEELALQMALIQHLKPEEHINLIPELLLFAGDHGIALHHKISTASSDFTVKMIQNFIHGGAGVNAFCKSNKIPISLINAGVIEPSFPDSVINKSLGSSTNDLSETDAMTIETAKQGIENGRSVADIAIKKGCTVILPGEMGIGNTSSASAILAKITGISADEAVGRGTGITDEQLKNKIILIDKAQGKNLW